MNEKIYFDLDTVDSQSFIEKLLPLKLTKNTSFFVDLFIFPSREQIKLNPARKFSNRNEMDSGSLLLIKTIPFVIYDREDRKEKLKSLFLDIFMSASYAGMAKYSVGKEYYNKAFCIEFNKSGLFR